MFLRSIVMVFGLAVSFTFAAEPSSQKGPAVTTACQGGSPFTSWKSEGAGFGIRAKIEPNAALEEQQKGEQPIRLLPATNKNRALFPTKVLSAKGWTDLEEVNVAEFDFDSIQIGEEGKTLVVWVVDENVGFLTKLDRSIPGRSLLRFPYTANCSRSGYLLQVSSLDAPSEKEPRDPKASSTR
jgi:hypothetical protein